MASVSAGGAANGLPPLTPELMVSLLSEAMDPQTVQSATSKLKLAMTDPNFVQLCVQQMLTNQAANIRQLSAILLRRRIARSWSKLNPAVQSEIKEALLKQLIAEEVHLVRVGIAHVISALAKVILAEWGPTLLRFLNECTESPNPDHREVAQQVFHSLLDVHGAALRPHFGEFVRVVEKGLRDATTLKVKISAMKGVEALTTTAESPADFAALRHLVQPMLAVIREVTAEGTVAEDAAAYGLEVLEDIMETEAFKKEDFAEMIRFLLPIASNRELQCGLREQALNFVHFVAKNHPNCIFRNKLLVPEILKVIISMGCEPDEEFLEEDELTPYKAAAQALDSLSIHLPSKYVFEPALALLQPLTQSANPWEKRGALVLLGIMSEGCQEKMRSKLQSLLPFVFASFDDGSALVRAAAGVCLGQMADYLQPEILDFHTVALQVLGTALNKALLQGNQNGVAPGASNKESETVVEKLCYALEIFADNLTPKEVSAHVHFLMPVLLQALASVTSVSAKANCLGAVTSVAQAAGEEFKNYTSQVFGIIEGALKLTDDEQLSLRARAAVSAGYLVQALPTEVMLPWRERLVLAVLAGLEGVDNHEIRESSYRFLGCLAFSMKDEFAPLLPRVMSWLLASLVSDEGVVAHFEETVGDDLFEGVDAEEDEEDDRRIKGYHVRTGFLDEQEAALDCIRLLFQNLSGAALGPYLQKTLESFETLHKYFHSTIRESVPGVMQAVLLNIHKAFPPTWAVGRSETEVSPNCAKGSAAPSGATTAGWVPGLPCTSPLNPNTKQLWTTLWPFYREMLKEDDNKEAIGEVCRSIGELLEQLGPDLLQPCPEMGDQHTVLMKVIEDLLTEKHMCQNFGMTDDDEDTRAIEESMFEGLSQLISGIAQVLGGQFEASFEKLHPWLLKVATHSFSSSCRCIGLGCYGDLLKVVGGFGMRFVTAPIVDCAIECLAPDEADVHLRRNASYYLGVAVEVATTSPVIAERLTAILQALHLCLSVDPEDMREDELCVFDNAAAAVARIIRVAATFSSGFPFADVVPVLLKALPIKKDFEESETVVKTLLSLLYGGCPKEVLEPLQETFLRVFLLELLNPAVKLLPKTKQEGLTGVNNILKSLGAQHPLVQQLGTCDPAVAAHLNSLFSA